VLKERLRMIPCGREFFPQWRRELVVDIEMKKVDVHRAALDRQTAIDRREAILRHTYIYKDLHHLGQLFVERLPYFPSSTRDESQRPAMSL
jgi:hypothetical protein